MAVQPVAGLFWPTPRSSIKTCVPYHFTLLSQVSFQPLSKDTSRSSVSSRRRPRLSPHILGRIFITLLEPFYPPCKPMPISKRQLSTQSDPASPRRSSSWTISPKGSPNTPIDVLKANCVDKKKGKPIRDGYQHLRNFLAPPDADNTKISVYYVRRKWIRYSGYC
jgi:hypothetical protein